MECVPDWEMDAPLDEAEHADVVDGEVNEMVNAVRVMPFRWTRRSRTFMVKEMLAALEVDEMVHIMNGGQFPNNPSKFSKVYLHLYHTLSKDLSERYPGLAYPQDPEKADIRPFQDAALFWTRRFLTDGNIHDKEAHMRGYKLEQRRPYLSAIRDMIMEGYTDQTGNTRLFRDMHHLQRVKKDEFQQMMEATGLKTIRSVWHQMRLLHPNLAKVAVKLKKERSAARVQACSLPMLMSHSIYHIHPKSQTSHVPQCA